MCIHVCTIDYVLYVRGNTRPSSIANTIVSVTLFLAVCAMDIDDLLK